MLRKNETFIIWGISFGILLISDKDPLISTILTAIFLFLYIWIKYFRLQSFLKTLKSRAMYINITNLETKKIQELILVPLLIIILLITILLNYQVSNKPIWIIFYIFPLIPVIFGWIINIWFSNYSYGLFICDEFLRFGFDGEELKYDTIEKVVIKINIIEIFRKKTNTAKKFRFSSTDIELIKKQLEFKKVNIIENNIA